MLPSYNTQRRRRVRARPVYVARPGSADYYIMRESSPFSLTNVEGLEGFGSFLKKINPVKVIKKVTSGVAKVATAVTKVATAPLRAGTALYAKTGLPGSSTLTKMSGKVLDLVEKTPASIIKTTTAFSVTVPSIIAKGIVKGNIKESLKLSEREVRTEGGQPLAALNKVMKVVGPVAAAFIPYVGPIVSIALAAAIAARDVYMKQKESKQAKEKMEGTIKDAYQTYLDATGKAGFTPVSYDTFHAWVLAGGGGGDIPLGAPMPMQAGDGSETSPTAPAEASSILPWLLAGAAAAAMSGDAGTQPLPAQTPPAQPPVQLPSNFFPMMTFIVAILK